MAGDWLKIEKITPDKPEIEAIATALDMDPDAVFGKCFRVWRWFDDHTEDGNAPRVSKTSIDRRVGVTGFADAMETAGWLAASPEGVSLVNFDRHNGETSKGRALTAKRVARHKAAANAKGNGESVSTVTQSALPREEKRREEKNREENQIPPLPPEGEPPPLKRKPSKADQLAMALPPLADFPEAIRNERCRMAWQGWLAWKARNKPYKTPEGHRKELAAAGAKGAGAFLGAIALALRKEWQGPNLRLYLEFLAEGKINPDGSENLEVFSGGKRSGQPDYRNGPGQQFRPDVASTAGSGTW